MFQRHFEMSCQGIMDVANDFLLCSLFIFWASTPTEEQRQKTTKLGEKFCKILFQVGMNGPVRGMEMRQG